MPVRPGTSWAIAVHRRAPTSSTARVSIASSSEVHACFFVRSFGLPSRTDPSCSGSASAVPPACAAAAIGLCATSDVASGMRSWPKSSPVRAPPFESSTSKSPPCSHDMPAVAIESPAAEGCAASAGASGTAETTATASGGEESSTAVAVATRLASSRGSASIVAINFLVCSRLAAESAWRFAAICDAKRHVTSSLHVIR